MRQHKSDLCAAHECFSERQDHHPGEGHDFLEPAPQPPADATAISERDIGVLESMGRANGRGAPAGPPVTGDGDAAVVREIANRWTKEWSGSEGRARMPGPDAIANAVREAIARGRELGEREDELMLFLAESVRDAFECDCEFEGDTCPCEGDGNDDEGCWRCQANAAIEARRAGRGTL
jgi:hypothetical protein